MNKLEQYLQQVCRSMGGPRELREHVRQELREHLLDAASQHQASGLTEEAAMDRALLEFGQPEAVRSELEATHGHRMMMAMVLDKALEWKERTMKAKWLWTTWTYLMVVGIIALEIFFCWFQFIYIIPKIKKLKSDGYFAINERTDSTITGIHDLLDKLINAADQITWWMILIIAAVWGLFEWRVKSENKTFIRLSVLGTAALGLLVVVVLLAGSLILIPVLAVPGMRPVAHLGAMESMTTIDKMVQALDESKMIQDSDESKLKPNWFGIDRQAKQISNALKAMQEGPMLNSLAKGDEGRTVDDVQAKWKALMVTFNAAESSNMLRDQESFNRFLKAFRTEFESFQKLVKQPVKPRP